jgi:hypothetical protein
MSHRSFFIAAAVIVLLFSSSARSQAPASAGSDESAALKKKAVDLLVTVAGQIDSLRSAENRARIGSNAAESLWDHDEKRARSLFAAVGEDIRTGFTGADSDREAHNHTLLVFWQLRSDTLGRIAKHDPELALQFLRATRLPADIKLPYQTSDTEQSQELRLAGQIAAKNPELALKLGRESLAQGFSDDLLAMLSTLQSKDKSATLTFYQEIVDKLKTTALGQDAAATQFAFGLAREFQPPQADERVYRELIGVLMASALANGCGKVPTEDEPEICYEVGSIFPKFEKYYGPRAAPLKRWAQEQQEGPDSIHTEMWGQAMEIAETGTVDEILAFVEKNPDTKYELIRRAIWKAETGGDFARARQLASEYPNDEMRPTLIAEIDLQQKRASSNPTNPASIQQALSTFDSDEERLHFLFSSAARIAANDRKAALVFLNQAGQIIDSTKGRAQLEGQVGLALMFCALKSDRGLAIVESLIPRLNQLVAAAAVLDGVENNYLSDEEWNMTGAGQLGGLLTVLAQNAGCFARLDFDRAVTIASQLERPELRLMTELKIAQGVLSGESSSPGIIQRLTVSHETRIIY